ncbi:hypothetical protein AB0I13_00300 [Streptomyces prasinus]
MATDRLRSCGTTHREVVSSAGRRSHQGLSSRAENSHRLTRQRERAMR